MEARLDGGDDAIQDREVLIVPAAAADQLPDAFDRIEFGTVGGQKMQSKVIGDLFPPRRVEGLNCASIIQRAGIASRKCR
jgi:hypothetical protein